ncbi:Protein dead ringer [Melipona quadrifasciata]|uniref:Protein dead ringer n=1 Tax=Melipona quadrifasciata TaxID=166423 RepID=A0A0N0BDU9_9HYME|nr:Protein dead ringer [Melipona quadrifasciata]
MDLPPSTSRVKKKANGTTTTTTTRGIMLRKCTKQLDETKRLEQGSLNNVETNSSNKCRVSFKRKKNLTQNLGAALEQYKFNSDTNIRQSPSERMPWAHFISNPSVSFTVAKLYDINDDPKRKEFLDDLFNFMQKRAVGIANFGSHVNPYLVRYTLDKITVHHQSMELLPLTGREYLTGSPSFPREPRGNLESQSESCSFFFGDLNRPSPLKRLKSKQPFATKSRVWGNSLDKNQGRISVKKTLGSRVSPNVEIQAKEIEKKLRILLARENLNRQINKFHQKYSGL